MNAVKEISLHSLEKIMSHRHANPYSYAETPALARLGAYRRGILLTPLVADCAANMNNADMQTAGAEVEANAAFIVLCVNSHDKLVEALKGATDSLEYIKRMTGFTFLSERSASNAAESIDTARQALKDAEIV